MPPKLQGWFAPPLRWLGCWSR